MESFCLGMLIGGLFQYLLHDIVIAVSGLNFNDDLTLASLIQAERLADAILASGKHVFKK